MIILESEYIWKKQQVSLSHVFFSPNISGFIQALQDFGFILSFCFRLQDAKQEPI